MNLKLSDFESEIPSQIAIALKEDIGDGDITAQLIDADTDGSAEVITREDCVVCGQAWFDETFKQVGRIDQIEWLVKEGQFVKANTTLVQLRGKAANLLTGERTALNYLQLLSGIASKAKTYADAASGSGVTILDTRKTIPGLRLAQKYAVAIGGCSNHRIGLYDAYLIKENHISACGGIEAAVKRARELSPGKKVEVEVEGIDELKLAVAAGADIIMLDNFDEASLKAAMALDKGHSKYELSGNLELKDIPRLRDYTIDYISFGALTKHVQAVDLSFRLIS